MHDRLRQARDAELMGDDIVGVLLTTDPQCNSNKVTNDRDLKLQCFVHHDESIDDVRFLAGGEHGIVVLAVIRDQRTNFFLACVENKDAFLTHNDKPRFRVVGEVSRPSISVEDIRLLNQWGRLYHLPWSHHQSEMIVNTDRRSWHSPTDIFIRPTVAEVVDAGFDRPSNSRLDILRFPRVVKIHHDHTFAHAVTLDEYQKMVEVSRNSCKQEVEENTNLWLRKLGFGHLVDDLDATTPSPQSTPASSSYITDSECDDLVDQQQLI